MRFLSVMSRSNYVRDITGHRSGRLVAIECVGRTDEGRALWRCECDCGGEKVAAANNLLRTTGTRSCGCLRREVGEAKRRPNGWNVGKTYTIKAGHHVYQGRRSWASAAIRHYGNRCERCGWAEARCDVHHRVPKSKGGAHTIDNAIVLCPNCHRVEHERARV